MRLFACAVHVSSERTIYEGQKPEQIMQTFTITLRPIRRSSSGGATLGGFMSS